MPSPDFDVGAPENAGRLEAKILHGDPLSSACTVDDRVVKVGKLLGPLTMDMVSALRCIGGNYKSHREHSNAIIPISGCWIPSYISSPAVQELDIKPPNYPILFAKFPNAVAGYGDDIPITKLIQDDQVDYEAELAVVIGKECKDVKVENAMEYVLGYTCSNDLSARFVTSNVL